MSHGDEMSLAAPLKSVVVTCIGNGLCADDAVGCAVYEKLEKQSLPKGMTLVNLGLGGVDLLEYLHGEELLIVVDAVRFGACPGYVHVLDWKDLPSIQGISVSAHSLGIENTVQIGQTLFPERMPERIVLVGIEGKCFNQLGLGLSPEVHSSLESAVETVHRIIHLNQGG